jgi:hypothetical protein
MDHVTRTPLAAALLILAGGCADRSAIPDPQSCDPGTTRYVCQYAILYDDPKDQEAECFFPPIDVCAPVDDASRYEQRQAAYYLGLQAYGDIPWGPGLAGRILDCETPDMANTTTGMLCAAVESGGAP